MSHHFFVSHTVFSRSGNTVWDVILGMGIMAYSSVDARQRAYNRSMETSLTGVDVCMIYTNLTRAPTFPLPDRYTTREYCEGDVETWVRLQRACADDLAFITAADFVRELPGDWAYLTERVLFLVDPAGHDIGTITAWNDTQLRGRDIGRIHWVAIVAAAQGRGLSKPMMSAACARLRAHGYMEAYLETHSSLTPAINLYLSFGFQPHARSQAERDAWREAAPRLKHPVKV